MKPYLELVLRDRDGQQIHKHVGQNIWVDRGRGWLRDLVHFASPGVPGDDRRLAFMGFGIGGNKQGSTTAFQPPLSVDYPGTNVQTDIVSSVSRLERPVAISPGNYLAPLPTPVFDTPNSARFTVLLSEPDVAFPPYNEVPISEAGLFLSDAVPSSNLNLLVAYDTFPSLPKTDMFSLEITWVVTF